MRLDRITTLRNHLVAIRDSKDEGQFEMADWLWYDDGDVMHDIFQINKDTPEIVKNAHNNHCGTRGCLAGWAVVLFPDAVEDAEPLASTVSEVAGKILGLPRGDRHFMFLGEWAFDQDGEQIPVEEITLDETIDYLDKVIDEGTVLVTIDAQRDWPF